MAPRRRSSSRSARDRTSGVPEKTEASGDLELREQLTTLVGVVRQQADVVQRQQDAALRQDERIKRLQETVDQLVTAPVLARRVRPGVAAEAFQSGSSNPTALSSEMEAERERALAALMTFKKFDPTTFDGEDIDPWTVESWIDSIETVFEDLYMVERDKVHLAVHCLQLSAKEWWKGVKRNRSPSLPPMTWQEFRELILSVYFPDSEKRKLRDRFRKLRQGDRLVREYEQEFSRIVNYIPSVVRDDKDRADCFVRGLRPGIFEAVHNLKLQTFAEVLDRALWIEQGNASVQEERESYYKEKGKERPASGYDGQSSSQRTTGSSRSRSRAPGTYRSRSSACCVICGGPHYPQQCEQRDGKCFRCGRPGHARDECPRGANQALTLATAFSPAARFGERQRIRQPRGSRWATSGRG
ncbi:uncharacterized protein LOC109704175 [Ananas comosus]|uniref:Uncharacterized protein LOC109704175 n=1 Tax=Ananas comosus TaxID=4615 RepID=A0A6P5EFW5_ANACO|nr:uncharacterized protein LOC109704175 [Ananas comosus]XP_020080515.1 uncharacterized protein LOC109704175 [Ananas comosus]